MALFLRSRFVLMLAVIGAGISSAHAQQSAARIWNEQLLSAIRLNVPNPPAHARNLHHVAVAMYDAWAAYDSTAVGYLYNEKVAPLPPDIEAARHEAVSYAAYRVLRARFASPATGFATSLASFDAKLQVLGYSVSTGQALITNGTSPAEVGKRIGQMVLAWGGVDGFSKTTFPQAYDVAVNPNMTTERSLSVLGNNGEFPSRANMPLGVGVPVGTDPNFWQPLALSTSVTQNGVPTPGGIQSFVGVQSLATVPFSLTRSDPTKPWIDPGPPSRLSRPGQFSATDADYKSTFMDVVRKTAHLNDINSVNISPRAIGNNPLGQDSGTGHPINPSTGLPYADNIVSHGDFARVLAEFWADGPNSETPPGHWHVLANEVADELPQKRIKGTGAIVNNLEWDIKTYLALSGAVHDAACAAWSLKRYYSGTRPITAIRYMASQGQSSNPSDIDTYDPEGIPLEADLVEVITNQSASPGGNHELIWNVYTNSFESGFLHTGEIAIKGWPGEHVENLPAPSIATHQSHVCWMLGKDWLPVQRKTFNTPAFPGYVSGHSTFSRSAAEVLVSMTGSTYFPGGFHHQTIAANSMQIDLGPSAAVDLQWATYYDAADQAGQSRRYGGIHPPEDDFPARTIGSQVGISAFTKAEKLWTGIIQSESITLSITYQSDGSTVIAWPSTPGRFYKVQKSTNFVTWSDLAAPTFATTGSTSQTDTAPTLGITYRIIETIPTIARAWNEQILAA
ncbi:MAG: vanadium-dependent haloperoxidase, partial [Prosthecobacter sp.]